MTPPPRPPVSSRDAMVELAERQTPRAIYVVSLLTAVAAFSLAVMRVPDTRSATASAAAIPLHGVSRALMRHMQAHGVLPVALEELVGGALAGPDLLEDAWGHPIVYARTDVGEAVLISFGADAREGGVGPDQDIVVRVPCDACQPVR